MELTILNYHGAEANKLYMSNSQYSDFLECAARTKAILDGKWKDESKSDALAIGGYVDAALLTPDLLPAYVERTKEYWFKKERKSKNNPTPGFTDEPTANVEKCEAMIARAKRSELFMLALVGEPQVIVTFEMFGVQWKVMMDVADEKANTASDLKTTASINEYRWSDFHKRKVPFYEAYNYFRQFGIYRQGYAAKYGKAPEFFFMPTISKEDGPDIEVFVFDDHVRFDDELAEVERMIPDIVKWKSGEESPPRCGACDYCRFTKELTDVKHAENFKQRGSL